jgi:squalene-associated FAD-dependent desaturase
MATVHIIGAGLSGLACAVGLAGRGRVIALYEAAPQAGGRCRSFFDQALGRQIDNGNHLLMSANRAALSYLERIGAADSLIRGSEAVFPFIDLESGQRWLLRPNRGRLPWWLLVPSRRVPGSRLIDYLSGLKVLTAGPEATVGDCVSSRHPLYRSFWEPLTLAALNADPAVAAAAPLRAVMLETFARGGEYCRTMIARDGLAASLVDPALAMLARHGARPAFGQRLRRLRIEAGAVTGLDFGTMVETVQPDDTVVLAVPAGVAAGLVPGLVAPEDGHAIVNAHFRLDQPAPLPAPDLPFVGVVGGVAHWVFVRGDVVSVTVSGADDLAGQPAEAIAATLWRDVTRVLGLAAAPVPATRIIKEKRATFVQTPANQRLRPSVRTALPNLFLAGDWTATGLPATIEGAVRSGFAAAEAITGGPV